MAVVGEEKMVVEEEMAGEEEMAEVAVGVKEGARMGATRAGEMGAVEEDASAAMGIRMTLAGQDDPSELELHPRNHTQIREGP